MSKQGLSLDPSQLRRNLITKNISLNWLIGRDFQIGDSVILHGRKAWPPCLHVMQLTGCGAAINHLAKQCGIGTDVVAGGIIRVGDPIFALKKG